MDRGAQEQERLFAQADMAQVLGYFTITPTPSVTDGLYSGDLTSDIEAIVTELGLEQAQSALSDFKQQMEEVRTCEDEDTFFHRVRKDYTHLYTNPHFSVSTLLQSRFMGHEEGAKGLEIALADTVQELKTLYASVGFQSSFTPALRPDHMAVQLAFMQTLLTNQGIALRSGDEGVAEEIGATARKFFDSYLGVWAEPFFQEMKREAEEDVYRFIGELGVAFMASLKDGEC